MNDWAIKICPLLNKQCLKEQCAWWYEKDSRCAVLVLKEGLSKMKG